MKKYKLKNGLTLLVDKRKFDSVAVGVLVKVGSNDEKAKERGIAHFMEHMLFEGTKTKSSKEVTSTIENVGGETNAHTTNERTYFYALVPKKYFTQALDTLADMLQNSTFQQKSFKKEKKVIINEIKMINDDPKSYQWILFLKTLFKKNRTKNPVYGKMAHIKGLKRNDIIRFYKKHYTAKNMIISIAGNVENAQAKVTKAFAKLSQKKVTPWKNPVELTQKKIQKKKEKRKINQTYLTIGYKTPPGSHKDTAILAVIRAILDRGQSARLFDEIRTKRGLAYAVGAAHEATCTYGYFAVAVITNKKNLTQVRNLVLEAYQLKNLTKKELDDTKRYAEGNFLLANEDTLERAEKNAFLATLGKTPKTYLKEMKKVTLKDVKRVAKKYFHNNYTEILIEQKD